MNIHVGVYVQYEGMLERLEPMLEEIGDVLNKYGFGNEREPVLDSDMVKSLIAVEPNEVRMPMEEWVRQVIARSYLIAIPTIPEAKVKGASK